MTCELAGDSQKSVTCPWARETLGKVPNRVRPELLKGAAAGENFETCLGLRLISDDDTGMAFLANIDPSLRDMSFTASDVNLNLVTSGAAPDGNSIPGGEPVHRSAFDVLTFKLSLHFQLSPRR